MKNEAETKLEKNIDSNQVKIVNNNVPIHLSKNINTTKRDKI